MLRFYLPILFFLCPVLMWGQDGFTIKGKQKRVTIPFVSANNLMIATVHVNGAPLNFIIDTGIEHTVLFSLEETESIDFKNVEKIKIRGLGSGDAIDAFKSTKNHLAVNNYVDENHEIYIILDQEINFSAQLGIPVHGIVGYYFFKNYPVEVNPVSHKIFVHLDSNALAKKRLKKFKEIPFSLELSKPYVNLKASIDGVETSVKMLVDTGGSDSVWLFENDKIKCPDTFFDDFLGRGFSGDIFGKRSRITSLKLLDMEVKEPTVSFPSAVSLQSVEMVTGRNGSIGSGVLRRFDVVFDYPNQKMYIKKNSNFDSPFNYNMSGMEIQHNGKEIIQETVNVGNLPQRDNQGNITFNLDSSASLQYNFILKPIFEVTNVRKNSPAERAGIMKGDLIKKINGHPTYKFKLSQIVEMLQSEEGRVLHVEYERNGKLNKTKLQLEKIL